MKNFWQNIHKPIIGLAPMEGYSDSAFRQVCKALRPDLLTYTEFTSADGLFFNSKMVRKKLAFQKSEKPILAQIFGKTIPHFVLAAKICEDMGFDGIDLNMGCPAKKVVKSEHGVGLRKTPDLAYQLIEAVAKAVTLPVSVKTRLGWDDASDLITFGIEAQNAGADMISVHGRTFKEPYTVPAQFEPIYKLKKQLHIPVLGNGGITSLADGLAKLGNLDGFLIGQASFGNPWVFSDHQPSSFAEKLPTILLHVLALIEAKGEAIAYREIRKHLAAYVKNMPGAKVYRQRLVLVSSLAEIMGVLEEIMTVTIFL